MINHLVLKDFRNFDSIDLVFKNNIVVFLGDNGVGKTSILEAIYLCSTTKSHKCKETETIKFEKPFAKIKCDADNRYKVVLTQVSKKVFINDVEIKKMSEFIGKIRTVLFSPEDMSLVFGSPQDRRNFLDMEISQISKKYIEALARYKKILKQRNELLKIIKINEDKTFLQIITKQLIIEEKIIISKRSDFVLELNELLKSIDDLEELKIIYKPSIIIDELEHIYETKQNYDILTQTTNYGIHRDDLIFMINNKEATYYSQGQNRSLVLAIKLALIEYIYKKTKERPIILFDDVLSELDTKRQNKLFELIDFDYQVFITTTDISKIKGSIINKAQIFFLSKEGVKENAEQSL